LFKQYSFHIGGLSEPAGIVVAINNVRKGAVVAREADVVIVGAGISGGALATALSRCGMAVLVLEKSRVHQDRVRGEFLAAWGVEEAQQLGILDVLMAAGGRYTPLNIPYGEGVAPANARARALDLRKLLPHLQGAMTFGHPRACQALDDAAEAAGATVLRGIEELAVTPGEPPRISFTISGERREMTPRVIVGADGRGSAIARQIGAKVETAPVHHLLAGLLVDGVDAWPQEEFSIGTEGNVMFFVFPQGDGRARLYLGYGLDQHGRFSGAGNDRRFLDAFRLSSLPDEEMFASARPAGPCRGYPNSDTWIDAPVAPGVVLIGDAAGHNDPTIGQGLSIAFRDARLVHEALLDSKRWTSDIFLHYVSERRTRMHRLRFTARQISILRAEFTAAARARRQRALERIAADPGAALPLLIPTRGPFGLPDHVYEQAAWDALLN
jgi:2-polyprenyl-6-methoxyphenol hydroxylase-like FAD-dependent oxidoreductase